MEMGKILIILGLALLAVGILVSLGGHLPWLGRLPGDITVKKENFTFFMPLTSCLLVSLIITLVLILFKK